MGSEKLDKLIDSTESLLNNLLHHVHKCDHDCCVKDVLAGIYEDNKESVHGPARVHTEDGSKTNLEIGGNG
jgi:hypothetical protein